jgi:hypothetical protein
MKNYLETIKNSVLPLNEKGELKQNVRNAFRSDFIEALFNALTELGLEAKITEDGIGIEIPNTELGSVAVVVSATVKDLSYSVDTENEAYLEKLEAKAEAERVKAELKARNLAEKEANKLAKVKKVNAKK